MQHLIVLLPNLLPESRRELEREQERRRQIREALAAQRLAQPPRFAALRARMRRVPKAGHRRPLTDPC